MQKSLMGMAFVAIGVIVATAVTTARSRSSLRADRVSSTEQSLVREAAPFNRLVHNRTDELKLELSRLASTHAGNERAPMIDSESFDGLAWIEPGATADDYTTKWTSHGSNIDASWLQNLPLRNLHDGDAIFIHHSQKNNENESSIEGLLMTAESFAPGATVVEGQGHRVILFGILNANAFAGLVDDWVGSSRIAQIFDEKGVILAHTNRRSVGAQLKEEGVVQAMASGKRTSVSGVFDDSDGRPLVAQAERIPQTNMRVSLSVPQRLLDQAIAGTVQAVFWASLIGFGLLAALAIWVYSRLLKQPTRSILATDNDDEIGEWSAVSRVPTHAAADDHSTNQSADRALLPLPSVERPRGLAARIAEAKGEPDELRSLAMLEPLVAQEATPVLSFADIESKAKLNVKEILDRSAAIRARLNLDFVEDYSASTEPEAEAVPVPVPVPVSESVSESVKVHTTETASDSATVAASDSASASTSGSIVRKPRIKAPAEPKL